MTTNKILLARLRATSALSGAVVTLALLAGAAAHAQDTGAACTPVGPACDFSSYGSNGSNGDNGGYNEPGTIGTPGAAGNDVTIDLETARALQSSGVISPVNVNSFGGTGGYGGEGSDGDGTNNNHGGNGGYGGSGGNLTVTIGSALSGQAISGLNGEPVSGVTIQSFGGTGGAGGAASYTMGDYGNGGAGVGGSGQTIQANLGGAFTSLAGAGAFVASVGGTGGGGKEDSIGKSNYAPDGAKGGNGGNVTVNVTGDYTGYDYGVFVQSVAGNGGDGNGAKDATSGFYGGTGGNAGIAGTVTANLAAGTTVKTISADGAVFYAASIGGVGGAGGVSHTAGAGGSGSDGGPVFASINGNIVTSGFSNSYGVLVQSLGGTGGGGGHSSGWFNPVAGSGATGGNGNKVTVTGTGANVSQGSQTSNENSAGVVAQSIGGGGGVGPDSNGWFAVGGDGGNSSSGNTAHITLTDSHIATNGFNSAGVIAQSIGGGGGKGGDATGFGAIVNMSVGGSGGAGGDANDANAAMLGNSVILTINKHSPALQMQSIGGGGGDGGAAYGEVFALLYGAAISSGGSGGVSGNGGTVNIARAENNTGQLLTFDTDSYGMVGQSIGGGGGNGGASTAKSIVKAGGSYPSQSLALSTGGSGGSAGTAHAVYLQNSGLVATTGGGSIGILAQAIGGGGGNAGDASASSSAGGGSVNLSVALAYGGNGGVAGDGGDAEATNHGLVVTTGESASAMLIQSIGGGGGNGGDGDAKSSTSADKSLALAIGSGGNGGGSGAGHNVNATNDGALITTGDGAHGIEVQTIAGGGGNAGGGAASSKGRIQIGVQLGGTAGNGGDTYYASTNSAVNNSGTIVTFGADATAILAQSIGGGGGTGGKAATSISGGKSTSGDGGNGDSGAIQTTISSIENDFASKGASAIADYNTLTAALTTVNSLLANSTLKVTLGDAADDADITAGSGGTDSDSNNATSIGVNVAVGGSGGSGGAGGYLQINNSGSIATLGKMSDAILVQSIGGGGGKGGAASTAGSANINGTVAVGGTGGGGGNGGEAQVNNSGTITTIGALAAGILAQSIGGGGGIAGTSVTSSGSSAKSVSIGISVGGTNTRNGQGEGVLINNSGAIETRGHDSIGIIAQSIAGGGGIVKTLATDLDNAGGSAVSAGSKDFAIAFGFGGTGTNGCYITQHSDCNSGAAIVNTSAGGTITTSGDDSYGILAQSVAGGGGLALGGKPNGSSAADFFGSGTQIGGPNPGIDPNPDNNKGVQVSVGDNIMTTGNGAVGVFAQSVGGGGGIAGDTAWTAQLTQMTPLSTPASHVGNGGDVNVTVNAGATVRTIGDNAAAIVAQTVGGGGGWIVNKNALYAGSAGGNGAGGLININIQGGVDAQGSASSGIFAQSTGGADNGGFGSGNNITIIIGDPSNICTDSYASCAAAVFGGSVFGPIASAVYVRDGGAGNTVTNYGLINTHEANDGYAFYADSGALAVTNYGIVTGNTNIGGNFTNEPGATYVPLTTVSLQGGTLTNYGTVAVGGSGIIGTTALTGNLVQTGNGKLIIDADLVAGKSDKLVVQGTAVIDGSVEVRSTNISNRPLTILTATGGVTAPTSLISNQVSSLYSFTPKASGNTLAIQPQAHFTEVAATLGVNQRAVAANLQRLFDSGANFDAGFNALVKVAGAADYAKSLNVLSGQSLGALAAYRFNTSHSFVANMYSGCATFDRAGARSQESNCAWSRIIGGRTSQNDTVDAAGYDATTAAFQLGGQRQIGDHWYLSGSLAYERSRFEGEQHSSKVTGDSLLGGAFLRYHKGPLQVSAAIDAGYGWYKSRRFLAFSTVAGAAIAKPEAWHAGVHGRISYELPLGSSAYLKPFVDGHVVYVRGKAFIETGAAPFNLAVAAQGNTALAGAAGAEIGTRIKLSSGVSLRPFASAAYEVLSNNDWSTRARFVGQPSGPSFDAETPAPDRLGKFAVGVDLLAARNIDLSFQYTPEVGSGYVTHAGVARLSYRF